MSIEMQEEAVFQLIHSPNQLPGDTAEGFRGLFKRAGVHLHHIADVVHEHADGSSLGFDDHIDKGAVSGAWRQFKTLAEVERGDDLSAQVDQTAEDGRGQGHARHGLAADDFLDFEDFDSEAMGIEIECAKLL